MMNSVPMSTTIDRLLGPARKLNPLSEKETLRLYKRVQEQGDHQARTKLVEHNLKLVVILCKLYRGVSHIHMEDLFQAGCFGLVKAINKGSFDPLKGKFSTYLSLWIKAEIRNLMQKDFAEISIVTTSAGRLLFWHRGELIDSFKTSEGKEAAIRKFSNKFHDKLSPEQISKFVEQATMEFLSLDKGMGEGTDNDNTLHDRIRDETQIDQVLESIQNQQLSEVVQKAINALPPYLQHVTRERFVEGKTLQAIGWDLGVSRERVRQIEVRALKMLRKALDNNISKELIG